MLESLRLQLLDEGIVATRTPPRLTIATRESPLALWQAHHIAAQIRALYPQTEVILLGMTTTGDQLLERTLSAVGGKGLFVKELEAALQDGRADLAVHSMKDVPYQLPEGFRLAAIGQREDPRDALVSPHYASLEAMPAGSRVGTASLRRAAQIRARYPGLVTVPVRGNVQTRLRKLHEGACEALILAAAGLQRLDLQQAIRQHLPLELSLPAVGQGALGIEIRADREDLMTWLAPLNDASTARCVTAERAMSRALAASCAVPVAGYCVETAGQLQLTGRVASLDGQTVLEARACGREADTIGLAVAHQLIAQGALRLLEEACG